MKTITKISLIALIALSTTNITLPWRGRGTGVGLFAGTALGLGLASRSHYRPYGYYGYSPYAYGPYAYGPYGYYGGPGWGWRHHWY